MQIYSTIVKLAFLAFLTISTFANTANAQVLFGAGAEKPSSSALDLLLKEAREDGSTVIVVKPGSDGVQASEEENEMNAERALKVRARLEQIVQSVPSLMSNIAGTFSAASPDGSLIWLLRALATALAGLVVGWYATRPVIRWVINNILQVDDKTPETTADKIAYLLSRALFAAISMVIYFAVAMIVAIVLDSAHEPSRRVIFEIVAWYCVYRFLRHGVSWNLFAGGMSKYRLVNLSDDEAVRLHRDWHVGVAICAAFSAIARFLSFTGMDQIEAGIAGGLTVENIDFIQICSAVFITLALTIYLIKDWKSWRHIFAPVDKLAPFYLLRTRLAGMLPPFSLIYAVLALAMFIYRLALDMPAPGLIIAAPFFIFYVAIVIYGIVVIIIQAFYNRRQHRFEALAEAEHERQLAESAQVNQDAGEEMIVAPQHVAFEYQPIFRRFFENAALAIIASIALGELARSWGVPVGQDGNFWAAILDIVLASVLCWIAYSAISVFINKRMEEEGGVPAGEEETGGEGGGAGATRMATLLPIMRYVLVVVIFSVGVMVILSRMGIDVAPIFAGAGVVGIAVGFGAQTLIRDIFSGAFFLMDDAFRKGEYVEIGGIKGTVEKISIRSFQLRHHLGALHTIPFGEIKQLTNYSRDWVLMKLPLRVTYDTDVDKVRKLVKKLGQELLNHPVVGHTFMQPLKSQGVYKMEDSAMIIRVKFMTKPGEQFVTRKVVYESIQDLFARAGVHFAHKEVTVRLADGNADELSDAEKQAVSSAARSVIDAEEEAAAAAAGGAKSGGDR